MLVTNYSRNHQAAIPIDTSYLNPSWTNVRIRFSEELQIIDITDCFRTLYKTDSSTRNIVSHYFSGKLGAAASTSALQNTEKSLGCEPGKLLYKARWEGAGQARIAMSVPYMRLLLEKVMQAKAAKLLKHLNDDPRLGVDRRDAKAMAAQPRLPTPSIGQSTAWSAMPPPPSNASPSDQPEQDAVETVEAASSISTDGVLRPPPNNAPSSDQPAQDTVETVETVEAASTASMGGVQAYDVEEVRIVERNRSMLMHAQYVESAERHKRAINNLALEDIKKQKLWLLASQEVESNNRKLQFEEQIDRLKTKIKTCDELGWTAKAAELKNQLMELM